MISLLYEGKYTLLETKGQIRMLTLDSATYAWVDLEGVGEILVSSSKPTENATLTGSGRFKIYQVEDEPALSDQQHLEISIGENAWQGYLLPTGLPMGTKVRSRIIPTSEIITPLKVA